MCSRLIRVITIVAAVSITLLSGCNGCILGIICWGEDPNAPKPNTLLYKGKKTLRVENASGNRRIAIDGFRHYRESSGGMMKSWLFKVNDDTDKIKVYFRFIKPLEPGKKYTFLLLHHKNSNSVPVHTWELVCENQGALYQDKFSFEISRTAPRQQKFDNDVEIWGEYSMYVGLVDVSVDIEWDLADTATVSEVGDCSDGFNPPT